MLQCEGLRGATVDPSELPLVIDEVPRLDRARGSRHGEPDSWGRPNCASRRATGSGDWRPPFERSAGTRPPQADDLVVAGERSRGPGHARTRAGDHRMAMTSAWLASRPRSTVEVGRMEAADVRSRASWRPSAPRRRDGRLWWTAATGRPSWRRRARGVREEHARAEPRPPTQPAVRNTGLMYRAVTLEAIRQGVDPVTRKAHRDAAGLTFDLDLDLRPPELRIEGSPPDRVHLSRGRGHRVAGLRAPLAAGGTPRPPAPTRLSRCRDGGVETSARRVPGRDAQGGPGSGPRRRGQLRALEREVHRRRSRPRSRAVARASGTYQPSRATSRVDSTHLDADEVLAIVLVEVRRRVAGAP